MESILSGVLTIIVLLAVTFAGFVINHIIVGRKLDDVINPSEELTKAQVEHHNNWQTLIIMIAVFIGAIVVSKPLIAQAVLILFPIIYLSILTKGAKLKEGFMRNHVMEFTVGFIAFMVIAFTTTWSFTNAAANIVILFCFSRYKLGSRVISSQAQDEDDEA